MKKRFLYTAAALSLCLSMEAYAQTAADAQAENTAEITAYADDVAQTYTGTVKEIGEAGLVLTLDDDSDIEIALTEDTTYVFGNGMNGNNGNPPDMPGNEQGAGAEGQAAPAGEQPENSNGTPPEMPDNGQNGPSGESVPEKPEGNAPDTNENGFGGMGEMGPSLESIAVGDTISVGVDTDGNAVTVALSMGSQGGPGGMPGGSFGGVDSYEAANAFTEDTEIEGESLTSTGTDENAVLVSDGAEVTLTDVTIVRDSEDSTGGDNSSFYGVGAAALVTDGTLTISDSTITTDAAGGAGAFSYGDGVLYISDTEITTSQDTSGGIHVAGGGTLYAWNVTATTSGESSAAVRSDRGSGVMVVDGGTYTSNGTGSPAVYSTADISINNALLTANNSEAICIEGLNTIRLYDCDLTGNMQDLSQNDCTWNVILYQSMSGDSEVGNSVFQMVGGTLTAGNGGMFYTTNTESTFILSGVDITYAEESDFFLKVTGNSNERGWGQSGNNGADCSFTAIDQAMEGTILWDSISTLDFYMTEGSVLTGAFVQDETNAGNGGEGYANVYIDTESSWIVTGDSTVTGLYSEGSIVDEDGNTVSIIGTDGTVYVEGTSTYTINVSSYSDTADLSGASTIEEWSDYEVTVE